MLRQRLQFSAYAYTGREWDKETGLYYYRARYYDPMEGRFISKDPIGIAGGINLYGYVQNNPVMMTDPTGESATDLVKGKVTDWYLDQIVSSVVSSVVSDPAGVRIISSGITGALKGGAEGAAAGAGGGSAFFGVGAIPGAFIGFTAGTSVGLANGLLQQTVKEAYTSQKKCNQ